MNPFSSESFIPRTRAAYLAFVSSRISFNDFVRPEDWTFTDPNEGPGYCMPDENVVVRAFTCPTVADPVSLFGSAARPTWVNNIELVELGANSAAPEDSFYWSREDDDQDMPKAWLLLDGVDYHGICERPTFGRRLLLTWFCGDDDDSKRVDRAKEGLKSCLGNQARTVWHSERFQAVAFVDTRRCEVIAEGLRRPLEGEFVWDWFIVEVAGLPVPDQSGVSPLAVWMESAGRAGRKVR